MSAVPIYLDHNATTPMLPEAAEAMREAAARFGANPASQHAAGREARRALEAARARMAEILGAAPDDSLIFTSGGTESNNLAVTGLSPKQPRPSLVGAGATSQAAHLVVSPLEHPSIARTADYLATLGWRVDRLPATADGIVQFHALSEVLRPDTRLVSVMLASNETGVLQPVAQLATVCRAQGVPLHTDATQVVGKLPVRFGELSVDAMTLTAHKFHGPVGIGALLVRHGFNLTPALHGGFQQAALRPGTESVALVLGMAAALEAWQRDAPERELSMTRLREHFERTLNDADPRAVVIGAAARRLPHTSNIAFVGLDRQALAMAFDFAGVACSTGSACASGSSEPSPALVAMGLPQEQIFSSIRFSLGATTTAADINEACRRILSVVNRLRQAN